MPTAPITNQELETLMNNWEAVPKSNLFRLFSYLENGNEERVMTYKIDGPALSNLLDSNTKVIRIYFGSYSATGIEPAGVEPFFIPIISGEPGRTMDANRRTKCYKMDQVKDFPLPFLQGAPILTDSKGLKKLTVEIPLRTAKRFVDAWEQLKQADNNEFFITRNFSGSTPEKLRYYTFLEEDTRQIQTELMASGGTNARLILRLGIENHPEPDRAKFVTVLHTISEGTSNLTENHSFFEVSSPCPPNCY